MKLLSLLPKKVLQKFRKILLRYGKSLNYEQLMTRSQQGAKQVALKAARQSEAYKTLLQEKEIDPASLKVSSDWTSLPVLTKENTFERFTLSQLSRPHACADLADVLTSSGRSGRSFGFKLTSRTEHESSWFDIDLGLQDIFKVDQLDTLLVNCLPMGVVFPSRAVTVANVSVREDMACALLRDIGPRFKQTLLCTDPLFVRRILEEASRIGLDWTALNTSVIMGEEMLVEAQRDYLAARMGIDMDKDTHRLIGSSYGVGELGLNLLFETRETIKIRRALRTHRDVAHLLLRSTTTHTPPSVFCFNPLRCLVEVVNPDANGFGELCITMLNPNALIALPRYATGDSGRIVSGSDARQAAALADTHCPWLPLVVLSGRLKDRPTGMPSVESVKTMIYTNPAVADQLTGAFQISSRRDGRTQLTVQAHSDQAALDPGLHAQLRLLLNRYHPQPIHLDILSPEEFPHRPVLDFERKFSYMCQTPE
jgi:phenylacetate-CoA ligase